MARNTLNNPSIPLPEAALHVGGYERDDEVDFIEFWQVLWQSKGLIISMAVLAGVLAAAITLFMPNIYKAELVMVPAAEGGSKGKGISAALGGMAVLAGVDLGSSHIADEDLAVLSSRDFLFDFIKKNNVAAAVFAEPEKVSEWGSYRWFRKHLNISSSSKSRLVIVSFEWEDPDRAAQWLNALVASLNQYLKARAIERSKKSLAYLEAEVERTSVVALREVLYGLIAKEQQKAMVANTQDEYAFYVLDSAVAPENEVAPKRAMITLLSILGGGALGCLFVFIRRLMPQVASHTKEPVRL